jgi:cytochrome P450
MVLYPDVFAKAQAELDRIIGPDRLPDLSDRDSLPYLDAIVTETFRYVSSNNISTFSLIQHDVRWNPALPLGRINYINSFVISEPRNNRFAIQGDA